MAASRSLSGSSSSLASRAVVTSTPASSVLSHWGTQASSKIFAMPAYHLFSRRSHCQGSIGQVDHGDGVGARHTWVGFQKLVQRVVGFQVVEQRLDGDAT